MVKMSVLNDALKNIVNAEKAGKRQVNPSLFAREALVAAIDKILSYRDPHFNSRYLMFGFAKCRRHALSALTGNNSSHYRQIRN